MASDRNFTKTDLGTVAWILQQLLDGTNNFLGGICRIPSGKVSGVNLAPPVLIIGEALDPNARNMEAKPLVDSGLGGMTMDGNHGAIINSPTTAQPQVLQFVILTCNAAFGGTGRWDLRVNPTASLSTSGDADNLIKVGANQAGLVRVNVDAALGNADVRQGILSYL